MIWLIGVMGKVGWALLSESGCMGLEDVQDGEIPIHKPPHVHVILIDGSE